MGQSRGSRSGRRDEQSPAPTGERAGLKAWVRAVPGSLFRGPAAIENALSVVVIATVVVGIGMAFVPVDRPVFQVLFVGVVAVLVAALIVAVLLRLAGHDGAAVVIAGNLTSDPVQRELLTRWLVRTRWARSVGGAAGLLWWAVGTGGEGGLVPSALTGVALGSMAAQLDQTRQPAGPRTANLGRRSVARYLPFRAGAAMVVVAAAAVSMVAVGLAGEGAGGAAWWALGALGLLTLATLAQRRVAARPRPALGIGLRRADDLARHLAIGRGLAVPAAYGSLALVAEGASHLEPVLGSAATTTGGLASLVAVIWWWQNRRLGLRWLEARSDEAPLLAEAAVR